MLDQLKSAPDKIQFSEVIEFIEKHYTFTPTRFINGNEVNEAGHNNGSCKILSFAKMKGLSKEEALQLFGDYYRKDVLLNPNGKDHQNIRNFINSGWEGVQFDGEALEEK